MVEPTRSEGASDLFNAGFTSYGAGDFAKALKLYHAALVAAPDWCEPRWHAGACCLQLRRYPGAIAYLKSALAISGDNAMLDYHLAKTFKDSGDLDASLATYMTAQRLAPTNPEILYSLGLLHLLRGDWLAGWPGYEQRWHGSDRANVEHRPATELLQWQGESVKPGSGITVYAEQGMGDSLMCFRYANALKASFAKVRFAETAPLVSLLQHSAPSGVEVVPRVHKPIDETGFTHFVHTMSLPAVFQATPANVPAAPYLSAPQDRMAHWRQRLAGERRPKIGLVWQGGKLSHAPARDMAFSCLAPLLARDGICWVSLQKEEGMACAAPLTRWMSEVGDMADTAALIANLDLVIAVDTAVAHLAGALGKPVWLLNRYESEWRWMHGKVSTPWYASMRIFSQQSPGDWDDVVRKVGRAVDDLVSSDHRDE